MIHPHSRRELLLAAAGAATAVLHQDAKAAEKYKAQLQPIPLFTIQEAFGGWDKAYEAHFKDGANFDQIYQPGAADKKS